MIELGKMKHIIIYTSSLFLFVFFCVECPATTRRMIFSVARKIYFDVLNATSHTHPAASCVLRVALQPNVLL